MMSNAFEEAFDHFIAQAVYDRAEQSLFDRTRAAFLAGWLAAGGSEGSSARLFQIIRPESHEE